MIEMLLGVQEERVSRDDLIKDLASERGGEVEKEEEEKMLAAGRRGGATGPQRQSSSFTPRSHISTSRSHRSQIGFFFFSFAAYLEFWLRQKGVGPPRTGSRKCHIEQPHLNISRPCSWVTLGENLRCR